MKKIHVIAVDFKNAVSDEGVDDLVILELFFAFTESYGPRHPMVEKLIESIIRKRSYLYEAILPFFENELVFENAYFEYEINKDIHKENARAAVIAFEILADALVRYAPA